MTGKELSWPQWFLLAATLAITLATSKSRDDSTVIKSYGVATNCGNAIKNNITITVSGTSITTPTSTSFKDFGMPLETLNVPGTQTIAAEISSGITRSCVPTSATNSGATMYIYSCSDNGNTACQVTFTTL